MAIALARKIPDDVFILVIERIRIEHHLIVEVGIVIVDVQFELLPCHWDIERKRSSCVPCLFLLQLFIGDEGLATCQQRHVLGNGVRRTVALACRSTECHILGWRILDMQTRSDKTAIFR